MQNKLFLSIFLIFTILSCIGQQKPTPANSAIPINKALVIGIWTDGRTENATFEIYNDSIYYVDSFQKFRYKITSDSLLINYDGFDGAFKIEKVTPDSLILSKGKKRIVYWKFKN